jgi:hypothetical protein
MRRCEGDFRFISEVTSLSCDCRADQTKTGDDPSLDCRVEQRKKSHPTTEVNPKNHNARPASQYFQFIRSAESGNNTRVESTTIAKPATPIRSIHRIIPISITRSAQRFKRNTCERGHVGIGRAFPPSGILRQDYVGRSFLFPVRARKFSRHDREEQKPSP